jgi:hypothetical protein
LSRVILDEGVPRQVGHHLPRHSVTTVPIEGWASVKNGELLALIGQAGFSAFISADKNLESQQSLHGRPFATLLLSTNHWLFSVNYPFASTTTIPPYERQLLPLVPDDIYLVCGGLAGGVGRSPEPEAGSPGSGTTSSVWPIA